MHAPRHARRKGVQYRTRGQVAPSPESITKRLRQDPPAVTSWTPEPMPGQLAPQAQQELARIARAQREARR